MSMDTQDIEKYIEEFRNDCEFWGQCDAKKVEEWLRTTLTKALTEAHQAGIDEAVEIVNGMRKEVDEFPDSYSETLLFHREDGYNQAIDDTIKALQDNK